MDFNKNKPIYIQIAHDIVLKILNKEIPLASLMMSVRELSVLYSVTPKTIQAVTSYLSLNNIIDKKPGVGSVITNDLSVVKEVHDLHGKDNTFEYVAYMKSLHYSDEEIVSFVKQVMKEEEHD